MALKVHIQNIWPHPDADRMVGTSVRITNCFSHDALTAGVRMARIMGEMKRDYGLTTSKIGSYAGASAEIQAFALTSARAPEPAIAAE